MNTRDVAFLLLASGLSSRFSSGDKLMAELSENALITHVPKSLITIPATARIAVIGRDQDHRITALRQLSWTIVPNANPTAGQTHSLSIGIRHIKQHTEAKAALILLADMPRISAEHVLSIVSALTGSTTAVMSKADNVLMPPALFAREHFDDLSQLESAGSARSLFMSLPNTSIVPMTRHEAMDVDTVDDLEQMREEMNG